MGDSLRRCVCGHGVSRQRHGGGQTTSPKCRRRKTGAFSRSWSGEKDKDITGYEHTANFGQEEHVLHSPHMPITSVVLLACSRVTHTHTKGRRGTRLPSRMKQIAAFLEYHGGGKMSVGGAGDRPRRQAKSGLWRALPRLNNSMRTHDPTSPRNRGRAEGFQTSWKVSDMGSNISSLSNLTQRHTEQARPLAPSTALPKTKSHAARQVVLHCPPVADNTAIQLRSHEAAREGLWSSAKVHPERSGPSDIIERSRTHYHRGAYRGVPEAWDLQREH